MLKLNIIIKSLLIHLNERVHLCNNEESVMLNIDTFKNLCMMSSMTKIILYKVREFVQ